MVREMNEVLKLLGWGDGFKIPMANEANKELERQVEEFLKKKAGIIVNLEIINEKEETMTKNLKAMALEQDYNQKLLNGLSKQLETDMKMMKDTEISQNQRSTDMKNMKKCIKQMDEKIEKLKADINSNTNKMNSLKESLKWGEDALFAWQEELAKSEKDTEILQMYKFQDEEKFQKLDLERKQVEADLLDAEELEKREADRHRILALQLENVSKLYKESYNERERLMTVWHDSVDICHNREEEIKRLTEILCDVKNRARNKCSELYEQKEFYQDLTRMNESVKKESAKYKNQSHKLKEMATDIENALKHYLAERDLRKKSAGNISAKIESERMKNSELQRKNKAHLIKCNRLLEEVTNLQQQCDVLKVDTLTYEQKYKNAQDVYDMSCKASDEESKEVERLYVLTVQLKQEINKIKEEELFQTKNLELSKKLEKDLINRFNNISYDVDVTENCLALAVTEETVLRQKIIELQDKCSGKEEREELETEIKELEPQATALMKEHIQLKMRLKSLQKEYRIKIATLRNGEEEIHSLSELYSTKKMNLQSDKKAIDCLKEDIQKNRLQLNLLMMKEHCIKENIARDDNTVCKLERQRAILEAAMRERQLEIEAQKELLNGKKRSLCEEKAMLGRTVEHLNFRLKQIQTKYGIAMDLLGKDDSGKQLSVAHFKIKLAQEKYDLQIEGDELEAKINKTEKEILAMESTLKLLTAANDNYKTSLEAVDKNDPDMIEKERMDIKYLELKKTYKEDSELWVSVKNEVEALLDDISNIKSMAKDLEDDWKIKEKEVTTLEKDLANKQQKLNRATSVLVKLVRDIRKAKEPPIYKKLAQKEIDIRIQEERNKSVLQQLGELSVSYVETKPLVNRYLAEYDLKLPHKLSSTHTLLTRPGVETARSRMSTRSDTSIPSVVNLDPAQILQEVPSCFKKRENKYIY